MYDATQDSWQRAIEQAAGADIVVKASGVGVFDEELEAAVLSLQSSSTAVVFWDVDAPATLDRTFGNESDPFRPLVRRFDAILTYGGGPPVIEAYGQLGAKQCVPIYNAVDPASHHPVSPDAKFTSDFALLANRLPDREARICEFFLKPAELLPERKFLLGGNGWEKDDLPANVVPLGHVTPPDHNALNCTPIAVSSVNRESMARYGWSPATRVFEAAGAGACLINDAWEGIEDFLEPDREVLVAANGEEVASHLDRLDATKAREIGEAALRRVRAEHTYTHRATQAEMTLAGLR